MVELFDDPGSLVEAVDELSEIVLARPLIDGVEGDNVVEVLFVEILSSFFNFDSLLDEEPVGLDKLGILRLPSRICSSIKQDPLISGMLVRSLMVSSNENFGLFDENI